MTSLKPVGVRRSASAVEPRTSANRLDTSRSHPEATSRRQREQSGREAAARRRPSSRASRLIRPPEGARHSLQRVAWGSSGSARRPRGTMPLLRPGPGGGLPRPGCSRKRKGIGAHRPPAAGRSGGGGREVATLAERMVGAARLDTGTYEEVEADSGATGQAALVVVISSICLAIGGRLGGGLIGLVLVALFRLLGWYVWALLTCFIGTRWLPGAKTQADVGQLLRTLGFASAPGVVGILGLLPTLGAFINVAVGLWMLVAMVIAVRQALDYDSTGRAVAVVVIG